MKWVVLMLSSPLFVAGCSGASNQPGEGNSGLATPSLPSSIDTFVASVPDSELVSVTVEVGTDHSVEIRESSPGVLIVSEKGRPGTEPVLADYQGLDALQVYRALSGAAADAKTEANISAAVQRAARLSTLLPAASPPDPATNPQHEVQKYYNPNGCYDNTQDLASFTSNYCAGGPFGSGWTNSYQSAAICGSWTSWFGARSLGVFMLDDSDTFGGACTTIWVYAKYLSGSNWVGNYSTTVSAGYWYYWTWNKTYQQWRVELDDSQCVQAAVYACYLSK